uniref:Palmitoyltransferase n=1 Tax=Hucho hucho TaxID=62062 RepID=A0A4W5M679_9TELE
MPTSGDERIKASAFIPVSTAAVLVVGSTTLFFVFTCPWLAVTVSIYVPPCSAILFFLVLANFTMATFMDAGILPMANEDEEKDDDLRAPLYKNVDVKGVQVRLKWCASCHFYRPPRCSHCSVCDHCVEDFDHHCPWVNNCIGRRNYRYFFLFLLSLTMHMVSVFSGGLLYILHHQEDLWKLHCTVTLVVVSVSGLFFIPVLGLTGFHLYLVSRGRTTNEQVTGKFQGGVNPFTLGCCGNLEYLICSPISPKYTARPIKKSTVHIMPPFLRPETDRQIPIIKVRHNGVQRHDLQSKVSLSLHSKPLIPPPGQILQQLRPGLQSPTKPTPPLSVQQVSHIIHNNDIKYTVHFLRCVAPEQQGGSSRGHYLSSEPILARVDQQLAFQSGPMSAPHQLNSLTLNSRFLTHKHAYRHGNKLPALHSEGLIPHQASPGVFPLHNPLSSRSSLSYGNLVNPGDPNYLPQRGGPPLHYHPHFLTLGPDGSVLQGSPSHAYSPVFVGALIHRDLSPQTLIHQEASPVLYDNLSKSIMASIQERWEMEAKDRILRMQARSQALYGCPDMGVYDIPSRRSLPADSMRPPGSRAPTPPSYGSREFMMSTGILGYGGTRSPLSSASSSSLTRAPRTYRSPLQRSSSLQSKGRSPSPSYLPPDRQAQPSPSSSTLPQTLPSSSAPYVPPQCPSLMEGKDSAPLRISSLELTAPQIAAQINASQSSSNRHISTSTVHRRLVNQAFMVKLLQTNHY